MTLPIEKEIISKIIDVANGWIKEDGNEETPKTTKATKLIDKKTINKKAELFRQAYNHLYETISNR